MRICAVQTKPIKGDIQGNIANHQQWIARAIAADGEIVIFPELSLTGYEPTLAKALATDPDDRKFDDFQAMSDANRITVGVGVPSKSENGVYLSMVLFQAHKARSVYSKSYLHLDEEPFFVAGRSAPYLQVGQTSIALAICYEIAVAEHLEAVLKGGPEIYAASVAKFVDGIDQGIERLSKIAKECSIPVVMSNCTGFADGGRCAGKTSVWDDRGTLIGQLDDLDEGMLVFDTERHRIERVA